MGLTDFEVKMVEAYVILIQMNRRTLASVPEKLRPHVAARLEAE